MDCFNNFDAEIPSLINLDSPTDDFNADCRSVTSVNVEYLSNVDYSLNSPLIGDEINEFIKFAQGRPFRKSWNIRNWEIRKAACKKYDINIHELITPTNFHNWFGRRNLRPAQSIVRITKLLNKTQSDSDDTFPIVKSFIRGWLKKDITNPVKNICPHEIMKWGAFFLDFHIITLFLNAIDSQEVDELLKIPGTKRLSPDHNDAYVIHTENFGKALVTHGFVIIKDEKVIMDRNTVLMCKDTYVARFQTLFSMINRVDQKFMPNDWMTILKLYQLGDRMLMTNGNYGYDGIRLIEPISSLQCSNLARQERPLIPEFVDFRIHLETSLQELNTKGIDATNLYRLILEVTNPELVLSIFGAFRHWGHPYVSYLEGLENVHQQVTMNKDIDRKYANALASDLTYIVLQNKFNETKRWYVDSLKLKPKHPFIEHIKTNTWPTPKQILDFGDAWHHLPLLPCFDIPDVIDPSLIYSDKSHSMDRSDVLRHVKESPHRPIPSKKVLQTFLNRPATNWKEFLEKIDQEGLSKESLVIGLKVKERELKIMGRFFTLMSWELREYFVVTEYLIKTHFVPLFKGLTMADDLTTVIKKLMDNSNGQGQLDYSNICIANHIDYTKWNNHQRHESNEPVFTVMGKFLGLPNLISRTHQFFQQSLIYYNGRPDLMLVDRGTVLNKGENMVCWEGQQGGLEGLRQKGWSVVNLLVIRRESIRNNTKVKILAQGDNQVICTQYKLQKGRTDYDLQLSIDRIIINNNKIMASIEAGTNKLGLIINRDETLKSADYLVYGKVPIYRGNLKGLEIKRWSRVTCVTNDQLPTLANTLSSINSNALTVSHFSTSPLNSMIHYNFVGNFGRNILDMHNPALKSATSSKFKQKVELNSKEYKSAVLYMDPCLGGACGMSLTRFLIRNFPDPLTESLSFWKLVHDNGTPWVKTLAKKIGNPKLGENNLLSFKKLLEDPLAINIPGGINPITLIKEEIKSGLIQGSKDIKNEIIRKSIEYISEEENRLIEYLRSIKPLFPRFLSEYISATYIGIVRSLIGLFQNSKTIRNVFSKKIDRRIKSMIIDSELQTIGNLIRFAKVTPDRLIWECSSKQADELRYKSWRCKVLGATVPHPIELIGDVIVQGPPCISCNKQPPQSYYISTLVPMGLDKYNEIRGPYKAYLGSKTSESTSILQPWEKDTKIPLIRRAVKLRDSIGWFVDRETKLAKGLLQNIQALTGEDWTKQTEGFKRTGSALHRFSCSRQSSAGYAAQSPSKLTWMLSTTDTLSALNSINYDFMHQSLLIYSQATISEIMDGDSHQGYFHSHITCKGCLREIEEIKLNTEVDFLHPEVHEFLEKWKPDKSEWSSKKEVKEVPLGDWSSLDHHSQSYHIGRAEGFLYGELIMNSNTKTESRSLFPLSIKGKVNPISYIRGLLNGLIRSSAIHCISRRAISELQRPRQALLGIGLYLINQLCQDSGVLALWRSDNFENLFLSVPHQVPPSYPLSNKDLGNMGKNYLTLMYRREYMNQYEKRSNEAEIWIFSDMNESSLVGTYALAGKITDLLYSNIMDKGNKSKIRGFKDSIIAFKDPSNSKPFNLPCQNLLKRVDSELRHACKQMISTEFKLYTNQLTWEGELTVDIVRVQIGYDSIKSDKKSHIYVPRIQNPLISGLRSFQFATGSHYKLRSILYAYEMTFSDAIVAGDGSGGISAMILRENVHCKLIFNSLLNIENIDLRGTAPSPPSAIYSSGCARDRCVNLRNSWEYPNDLRDQRTWEYFIKVSNEQGLYIELIVIDAEVQEIDHVIEIENLLSHYVFKLLNHNGTLIYKTYLDRILNRDSVFLTKVGCQFRSVEVVTTDVSSSQTSEVYLVCRRQYDGNLTLYPSRDDLFKNLRSFPCFKSLEDEFKRARKISSYNFLKGVPKVLIPDKYVRFQTVLESLGVETGVSALLSEYIKQNLDLCYSELVYGTLFIILNSLINFTAMYTEKQVPKSDRLVYNTGIILCSFLNWLSLSNNSIIHHKIAQSYISTHFLFSWNNYTCRKKTKKEKKNNKGKSPFIQDVTILHYTKYSFSGKFQNTKNFFLDSKMSRIGDVMRVWSGVFRYRGIEPNPGELDSVMKKFDESLSLKTINFRTDLFDLLMGKTDFNFGNIDAETARNMNEDLEECTTVS